GQKEAQKQSSPLPNFGPVAKVVPIFACGCKKPDYLKTANGPGLATIYAPDAVVGACAATPAIAGVAPGADPRTQGARRTGIAAKSCARRNGAGGNRPARPVGTR